MAIALLAFGFALVAFGAVVLLRYSDRPGGSLKLLGMEMSSTGAGLPLVGLGVACVLLAFMNGRDGAAAGPAAAPDTVATRSPPPASGAPGAEAGSFDACFAELDAEIPADRTVRVEAGMREVEVIGPHQPLDTPFAVILTEGGAPVGAVRLRLYRGSSAGSDLYRVEAAVDARCQPVTELRNASRGGDPRALTNWDTLWMRLGGNAYEMRIGGEGNVTIGYFRRAS